MSASNYHYVTFEDGETQIGRLIDLSLSRHGVKINSSLIPSAMTNRPQILFEFSYSSHMTVDKTTC